MEPLSAFFWAGFKNTASSTVLKSERTTFDEILLERFRERSVCCSRDMLSVCQRRTCLCGVVRHVSRVTCHLRSTECNPLGNPSINRHCTTSIDRFQGNSRSNLAIQWKKKYTYISTVRVRTRFGMRSENLGIARTPNPNGGFGSGQHPNPNPKLAFGGVRFG